MDGNLMIIGAFAAGGICLIIFEIAVFLVIAAAECCQKYKLRKKCKFNNKKKEEEV